MNNIDLEVIKETVHWLSLSMSQCIDMSENIERWLKTIRKLLWKKKRDKIMDDLYTLPKQKWYDIKNDSKSS